MIEFKSIRQSYEFVDPKLDPRLRIMILTLAGYGSFFFRGKTIKLTELFRTDEEQDEIYKDDPIYQKSKWKSVHQFWRGADIRLWEFEKGEIESMVDFINKHFKYSNNHFSALAHDVKGYHLHLQVDGDGITEIV
jgi:hypothetical protein